MIRYDDMMIVQHTNSANLSIKCCNMGVLLLHVTGTTHNVVGLVKNTSVSTRLCCSQVPTPSPSSLLVINTTSAATPRSDSSEQIEEWSLSFFIVAVLGDSPVWIGL